MRRAVFITVRLDSARLPEKAFKKIQGKYVLEHIIQRAKLAKKFDGIVVCTSDRKTDDPIEKLAYDKGVCCFRGSLNDKLERWRGAAEKFGCEFFVTFDGDDLFCEPELLDSASKTMDTSEVDFLEAPDGLVCGAFTYAIRTAALNRVCAIKNDTDTEMIWRYFKETGLFKTSCLPCEKNSEYFNSNIRLTLDYEEDFDFFTKVFESLNCENNDIQLKTIIEFLNRNPEVVAINSFRQAEFLENQRKKAKLVLKEEDMI